VSQSFANPYDFTKPVRNPELFAGRQRELAELEYYLELCRSERPVFHNLAMIGARAAGKTSLLNVIEHLARKKGILAVKVSLNAESSSNEVILFKEVIDAIMTKGAELGMFEGLGGKVYKSFRKIVDLLDAQAEIPLLFGTAYIGVKKNTQGTLSQQVLVHDLTKLWEEAKKHEIPAIALLFDECDLLAKNEALLQKLRNIFSDIDGYLLVFAGTVVQANRCWKLRLRRRDERVHSQTAFRGREATCESGERRGNPHDNWWKSIRSAAYLTLYVQEAHGSGDSPNNSRRRSPG